MPLDTRGDSGAAGESRCPAVREHQHGQLSPGRILDTTGFRRLPPHLLSTRLLGWHGIAEVTAALRRRPGEQRGRRDNLRLRMAATAIPDTSGFLQDWSDMKSRPRAANTWPGPSCLSNRASA
jgi:hypothetical protein